MIRLFKLQLGPYRGLMGLTASVYVIIGFANFHENAEKLCVAQGNSEELSGTQQS